MDLADVNAPGEDARLSTYWTSMKKLVLLVLAVSLSLSGLMAQSVTSLLKGGAPAPAPTPASADPLGRDTPSGTVLGFLRRSKVETNEPPPIICR